MNEEQNWKDLNQQADQDLVTMLQPGWVLQIKSADPLQKIKASLGFTIAWTILLSALYIVVLLCYPYWQVLITIGAVLAFTVLGGVSAFRQYKKIEPQVPGNRPLLAEMESRYKSIRSWADLQMKAAIFIYPFACAGGFMIGLVFGSGKSLSYMINKPGMLLWLIGLSVVIVPCGLFLARWLLNKSYGRHLLALKKNIDELKAENGY